MSRALRSLALALLLVVLGLALLTWRAVSEGEAAMQQSDVAFNAGDVRGSLVYARRAATSYAPGAPHVSQAYARLQAIAIGAEAKGDLETAAEAWRGVRSAVLDTRSLITTRSEELSRANRALARLATRTESDPELRKAALEELEQDQSPRARWILLMGLGLLLTAGGLITIAVRGVSQSGEIARRPAWIGGLLALCGAVCWTVAVWLA